MRRTLFLMSFGIGAMILAAQQANAQTRNCAAHAQIVERLGTLYGENRQSIGLTDSGAVVEVFASMDTGSWTITITQAGEQTCLVAAGQAFQHMNDPLSKQDQGA